MASDTTGQTRRPIVRPLPDNGPTCVLDLAIYPMSLDEIASALGVSKQAAQQKLDIAISRLQCGPRSRLLACWLDDDTNNRYE